MDIYRIDSLHLTEFKETPFKLEKDMQAMFERHLYTLTGLQMVKSEFILKHYRFDTLAFDVEKKAFVVIEYKRDKSQSVVDQGVSYLNAMFEYKDSLIVEYNERYPDQMLKRSDVDWSQSRILFVANAFTAYQKQATNFKDLGISLVEFKRYSGDLLSVNLIQRTPQAPSLVTAQASHVAEFEPVLMTLAKEIKVYDEAYHLQGKTEAIVELYEKLRDAILNLNDGLNIDFLKYYIAFKAKKSNVVDLRVQNSAIKIWLNAKYGTLDDSKQLFRDVSAVGHYGNGEYELHMHDGKQIEYVLSVIKQVL